MDTVSQLVVELEGFKQLKEESESNKALIAAQAVRLEELEARLKQNSQNSGRPPSSDGYKKPKRKPAFPRKTGKKRGGQPGHKGRTLEMVERADQTIPHAPEICTCGQDLSLHQKKILEKRQVFDLPPPRLHIVEHQVHSCVCEACGKLNQGSFPDDVPARVQYGHGVRALSSLLYNSANMSFGSIRCLFSDLFGYELNESTQFSTQQTCYHKLEDEEARIKNALLNSSVNHYDESGLRVNGKLHWLHNCSTKGLTYLFVHPKRGKKALEDEASILPHYKGWAIHDRWRSYFLFDNCRHADCVAHLLRDLNGLIEQGSKWAAKMHDLLMEAYRKSNYGKDKASNIKTILKKYDRICRMGQREEPPPEQRFAGKRPKKTKGRNLLEHLQEYKDAVLAFALHPEVPFTNNQAERDIRPIKVKQKVSGCFRTFEGAQYHVRIRSFISTARKQQLNVFNELLAVLQGKTASFDF